MPAAVSRSRFAHVLLLACVFAAGTASAAPPPRPAAERTPWAASGSARWYALRLRPGQDLRVELTRFAREHRLRAAFVASAAGSLTRTSLRYANQSAASMREGHFEIVSLSGTLAAESSHLHASVSDSTGATFGGHLMDGSLVYTTVEVVIGELSGVVFAREPDSTYGYRELSPRPRR